MKNITCAQARVIFDLVRGAENDLLERKLRDHIRKCPVCAREEHQFVLWMLPAPEQRSEYDPPKDVQWMLKNMWSEKPYNPAFAVQ